MKLFSLISLQNGSQAAGNGLANKTEENEVPTGRQFTTHIKAT